MSRLVLGIDEAGRGPALGAMVMAAVALEPVASRRLRRAGVADSKSFGAGPDAHQKRLALYEIIRAHAAWIAIDVCDVAVVDEYVARGGLNELERERAAGFIRSAPACVRIIADGRRLFHPMCAEFPHLEARDRAESYHVAVAAASICAKVRRDELFACIAARYAEEFGPVAGGGYVNAATRAFARAYVQRHGALPPEARHSWPWQGVRVGKRPQPRTRAEGADAPSADHPRG
jgi:ribonuclease HII